MDVCLITGTSTGIGRAAAIHFARNGFRVVAAMRRPERAAPFPDIDGAPIRAATLDVTDADSIRAAMDDIEATEGRIDVLVNNAGLSNACPAETYPEAEHRALFETNYWGPVRLCQAALPGMRARGRGAIVNLSSILGRVAAINQAAYCASKFAIEAFSESLALEVAPLGIRVVIVEPGVTGTAIFENTPVHYDRASPYRQAMRKGGRFYVATVGRATPPEEIAAAIFEAVTTRDAKLRWMRGLGSEFAARRPGVSDEDYIAMSALDDDAYNRRFAEFFGVDLTWRTDAEKRRPGATRPDPA